MQLEGGQYHGLPQSRFILHTGKQKQKPFRDFLLGPIFDLLDSQDDIDHATYVCMQESKIRLAFASARLAPSPRSANALLWMRLSAARSLCTAR